MEVQLHKCVPDYCSKSYDQDVKKTNPCRFGFPLDLEEQTRIDAKQNKKGDYVTKIIYERNHGNINNFNKAILSIWRSNMDIKLIYSWPILKKYLLKYIAKSEKMSKAGLKFFLSSIDELKDEKRYNTFIRSRCIKFSGERDMSNQECKA